MLVGWDRGWAVRGAPGLLCPGAARGLCFSSACSSGVEAARTRRGGGRPSGARHCGTGGKMADAFGDELFSVFEEDSAAAASGAKKSKAGGTEGARRPG